MNDSTASHDESLEVMLADAADEYLRRMDCGQAPDAEEYAAGYPEISGILRQVLPAVKAIHRTPPDADAFRLEACGKEITSGKASPAGAGAGSALGCLGDFRLVRELGRGGMGVVYEAEQISLGRRVALKMLPLAAALDQRQLQRFRLEAQACAHLHHSHIVHIYSVGCERGVYYYAMQYVEGRSLAEIIAELQEQDAGVGAAPPTSRACKWRAADSVVPAAPAADTAVEPRAAAATVQSVHSTSFFRSAAGLGIQAAEALDYAASMGVVHRDVKPANLLLDMHGNLCVTDFGLAQLQNVPGLTMSGDLVGTLRYMSPEQALAKRGVVDHRTDIYSLGATLYELLTLTPAFDAPDRRALLWQIAEAEPAPPRQRNKAIPVDLETIVLKAMAKDPGRRYASGGELADDLRRFLDHRPILARRPTLAERAAKWSRRHRPLVAAAVILLLLSVVGFAASTALIAREQWKTKAANGRLAKEQARTKVAYEAEARQRSRAEQSLRQARQVVDFFTEASENDLADKPELQGLRRKLLAASLKYYQDFIEQSGEDPSLKAQLAASHLRVATILDEMGSKADALAAIERARNLQETLVRGQPAAPEFQRGLFSIFSRFGLLRGGRELNLLIHKAVQDDLKLSSSQIEQISGLWEKRLEAVREFRDLSLEAWQEKFEVLAAQETALAGLLQPAQRARLRQIALQRQGTEAFHDPEVAAALQLTDEQKDRMQAVQDETRRMLWESFRPGSFGQEERTKLDESLRNAWDQTLNVLTDEQRARWRELTGEPFKGKIHRPGPWGLRRPDAAKPGSSDKRRTNDRAAADESPPS